MLAMERLHEGRSAGASSLCIRRRGTERESQNMPGVDFSVLRREITMQQVLDLLDFQATSHSGDQLHGPCPVHGSTSAGSRVFSVNLSRGRYYCHKCESQGNQLELWVGGSRAPAIRRRSGSLRNAWP